MDAALEPAAHRQPASDAPELSVVIPCLDEARTVGECVAAALDGIRATGLAGEVIVADNGSTDGSPEIARAAGARVVNVPRRGYGAALQAGFRAARGRLLVMGDADLSYDFRELPRLVDRQRETNADIVVGDRLGGRIERGAMPWSHRLIGNPLISFTIRRFFRVPLRDCYCGLRLLTRESHQRLRLSASSMEYALEMIVQGALVGLRFTQVPITLHVDGRDTAPHLRTVRDGYRSFRFLFQHAPITVYGGVGSLAAAVGLALVGRAAWDELHGGPAGGGAAAVGAALLLTGWLLVVLGVIARVFVAGFLGGQVDPPLRGLFRVARLETAVLGSAVTMAAGLLLTVELGRWAALFQLGLALSTAAVGTFVGAFVVSLVGRAIPTLVPDAPPTRPADVAARAGRRPPPPAAEAAPDPGRGAWIAASLRGAWDGAGRVLCVGSPAGGHVARAIAGSDGRPTVVELGPEAASVLVRTLAAWGPRAAAGGPADDGGPQSFDAAVVAGLLEHVDDDVGALRAVAARLRPGGRLGLLVAGGGPRLYGPLDEAEGRVRRYTGPRLAARLRAAGFRVESVRPVDLAGAVRWFLGNRLPGARPAASGGAVPLARALDALLGPPFGRSLVAVASLPPRAPDTAT
jgi:SAM-dependent methyltransferase